MKLKVWKYATYIGIVSDTKDGRIGFGKDFDEEMKANVLGRRIVPNETASEFIQRLSRKTISVRVWFQTEEELG